MAGSNSVFNQIFDKYGRNQFATKFMFRSTNPSIARLIINIFCNIEYASQQKIPHMELANLEMASHIRKSKKKRKSLLITNDIAILKDLEWGRS